MHVLTYTIDHSTVCIRIEAANLVIVTLSTEWVALVKRGVKLPPYYPSTPIILTTLIDEHSIRDQLICDYDTLEGVPLFLQGKEMCSHRAHANETLYIHTSLYDYTVCILKCAYLIST